MNKRQDELLIEIQERAGWNFRTIYQALREVHVKSGRSNVVSRQRLFDAIDRIKQEKRDDT